MNNEKITETVSGCRHAAALYEHSNALTTPQSNTLHTWQGVALSTVSAVSNIGYNVSEQEGHNVPHLSNGLPKDN